MRIHMITAALLLGVACPGAGGAGAQVGDMPPPASADAGAEAMKPFARLVGGEWEMTLASGVKQHQAWQWGPGKHSVRLMEYGAVSTASGGASPWAGEVIYWHPGRKEVRVLSVHGDIPGVGRGVGEGTISFDGEKAEGRVDLYQPRGPRKLGTRWAFDGPDRYRDELLEDTGGGMQPQNGWTFSRVPAREPRPAAGGAGGAAGAPTGKLRAFEPLLGAWQGEAGTGESVQTTFEWLPSLQVVCARTAAAGEPSHRMEAYFYEHVKDGVARCLALSSTGGVYEGDVRVAEGGALEAALKGYEGDKVVDLVVRLDVEGERLRQRVWVVEGAERRPVADVAHSRAK